VPELLNISNIYGVQVANVGSPSINSTILLDLARHANDILCSEGSTIDSVVITHGTDTLEETAFFMDATVNCGKPVVIVGAMRPATAISADGPANLYQAVQAGVFPDSKNRGALIILNDRIGAAYYTQKTHGAYTSQAVPRAHRTATELTVIVNYLDTFKAPEPGYLGGFFNHQPFYYYEAARPTCECCIAFTTSIPSGLTVSSSQKRV
jgi:L-asparaginase